MSSWFPGETLDIPGMHGFHDGIEKDFIVLEVLQKMLSPEKMRVFEGFFLDFVVSDSFGNCQSDNRIGFLMYQRIHLHKEPTGIPIKIWFQWCF